jgi:hypothetical protein
VAAIRGAEERRRYIAGVIARCEGSLLKTAFELGIHRSHLYRLIWKHKLWPVVNAVRRKKAERRAIMRRMGGRGVPSD